MKLLVATDIHGPSPALDELLTPLKRGRDCIVMSPWHVGRPEGNEADLIKTFQAQGGIADYAKRIAAHARIHADSQALVMIGFSVGATSIWHALEGHPETPARFGFLYYGSRIRDALQLQTQAQLELIFAEHEASFTPSDIVPHLQRATVCAEVLPNLHHGFMNPLHERFDLAEAQRQLAYLERKIANWSAQLG